MATRNKAIPAVYIFLEKDGKFLVKTSHGVSFQEFNEDFQKAFSDSTILKPKAPSIIPEFSITSAKSLLICILITGYGQDQK